LSVETETITIACYNVRRITNTTIIVSYYLALPASLIASTTIGQLSANSRLELFMPNTVH
jgi:hypothetical protein